VNRPENQLVTPIYLKTQADTPWPEDKVFYLLTADGLFLCRNHPFFRSCVRAPRWPTELARHEPLLAVNYPKLSRRLMERVVGFFDRVAQLHTSEAGVLLAWDPTAKRVRAIVPDQVATVNRTRWGDTYPIGLEYEAPANLPADWTVIGDVHSHVDAAAYASYVDQHDETHRPGLHIVVGRIQYEPPDFHVEAVVDGTRFTVQPDRVIGGYQRRNMNVPAAWLDKVTIKAYGYKKSNDDDRDDQYAVTRHDDDSAGGNGNRSAEKAPSEADPPLQEIPDDLALDLEEVLEEEQDERS